MTDPEVDQLISLRAAATELSLHYMTVYRYVRTGRLPAHKVDGEWRVNRTDLALLTQPLGAAAPPTRARYRSRLQDRLVAADERGAWSIIESALASGADAEEIYLRLLIPAMHDIGRRWEAGDLAVVDEHQATAVATRIVGRMGPRFRRPGRRRGAAVLGAVSGDSHALPSALLADLLRGRRFEVVDLGGNTPAEAFAEMAHQSDGLRVVVLSCSTSERIAAVAPTVDLLRASGIAVPILAGGCVLDADSAQRCGADGGGRTAEEALELIEGIVGSAGGS